MEIKLERYDHTCADGCCYTTGYDVFIDGENIGHTIGEDAMELAELLNETFNIVKKCKCGTNKIGGYTCIRTDCNQNL